MAAHVRFTDPRDVAHCVDALLEAAELRRGGGDASKARRYVAIANALGDAADACSGLPACNDTTVYPGSEPRLQTVR